MKEAKNELMQFVAGIIMLVVGLYIFSQKVIVFSGFFSFGGGRFSSGLIVVPLIIGIVWMFVSGANFASKVFTVLAAIIIIASVVMTTNIPVSYTHLDVYKRQEWDRDIKFREPEAMQRYEDELSDDIGFWNFIQYEFYTQWGKLKAYANSNGIEIIGDIPIYMGYDSVDVWANQAEFQLDENLTPVKVAGVPPDAFSDMGQKWGNPLYDWAKMENSDFGWWRMRMANSARLYDIIRIEMCIRDSISSYS